MAITDPAAIKFSNEWFRTSADRLARCFYLCQELKNRWTNTPGTNDEKFALLLPHIKKVATRLANTYFHIFKATRIYDSASLNSLFPNDANEVVYDNVAGDGPDPNRPTVTGQSLMRLKRRMEEFNNWLARGTDLDKHFVTDSSATLSITYAYLNDIMRLVSDGSKTPTTAWGRQVAEFRTNDLITEWTVTNPNYIGHILACSVNSIEELE